MEIKSVAVLGAGAVGSYVIWGLSGVKNIELGVVAEGERAKHLMKVKGCVQSRNFLQIQGFIFAIQTISGRRCGANSG